MKIQLAKIAARAVLPLFLLNPFASFLMRSPTPPSAEEESAPKHEIGFTLFDYDEPMQVHKNAQARYLLISTAVATPKYNGQTELSRPLPAVLGWRVETDEDLEFDEYKVYFSENSDMSDAKTYVADDTEIDIYNVKLDTTYYWYVSVECDGDEYRSEISSFETESIAPRNMFVDGVTNVRDMGGWATLDGGEVKQGMVYRTGRLHTDDGVMITESGIETMLRDMRIKTEIDLRNEIKVTEFGPLGEEVNYIVVPMSFTDDIMLEQKEEIRTFFEILSDEENYPVIFHCYIGTDRTGVCAFLLNGLLGVSEEDLYRDYCFSNFGLIGSPRDGHNIEHYLETLENYDGETTAERIHSYLLSIGVTEEEIASIISIMKEEK